MKIKLLLLTLVLSLSLPLMANHSHHPDGFTTVSWEIQPTVYPNPSNGLFHLNIKTDRNTTYEVKVVNLIGKTLIEKEVESNFETEFDLTTYPKGVYFLQISLDKKQIIKRIVVQ